MATGPNGLSPLGIAWMLPFLLSVAVFAAVPEDVPVQEVLLETVEDEAGALSTLEYFAYYRQHPLCLSHASVGELCRLPGITTGIARQLRALLQRFPHLTYAELADSLGLTPEQRWVLQQATTRECVPPSDYTTRWRSLVTLPLVEVVGKERYVGSFVRAQGWGEWAWHWFRGNIAWDKDAGEPGMMDFVSASVQIEPWSGLRWILGDFRLSTAMGMLFWGRDFRYPGYAVGAPLGWKTEARPWGSVQEYGFFRGGIVQWEPRWDRLQGTLMAWLSSTPQSGTIDSLGIVRSVITDGIFALPGVRSRRHSFRERSYGVAIEVDWGVLRAAASLSRLEYSNPVATQSFRQFLGRSGNLFSLAVLWQYGGGEIAGEIARDAQGVWAFHGAVGHYGGSFQATVAVRNIPGSFRSPYGAIVGRTAGVSNEEGLFAGVAVRGEGHRFQLYADLFRTPVPPYGMPVAQQGSEVGIRWVRKVQKNVEIWLQWRYRTRSEARRTEVGWQLYEERIAAFRGDMSVGISRQWRWRFRAEARHAAVPGPASSYLGMLGGEAEDKSWQGRVWLGVYAVPVSTLGLWVYETVATQVPRLHFLSGYGSYATLWIRWSCLPWASLEAAVTLLRRSRPESLWLWGTRVHGAELLTTTLAAELCL
ncbi:MAG: hypothetical protein RMJ46_01215 [Bacteroidota bacterium]|nr:hypothetical protein [Bacteroidota bacterium]